MRPELINAGVLAYLGDSVFEVMVRDYLVRESELVSLMIFKKKQLNTFQQVFMQDLCMI